MGLPFFTADVPADRAAILRNAFDKTMADAEYLAEATKAKLEINPVSGVKVEQIVKEIYQTPPDLVKKAAELIELASTGRGRHSRWCPRHGYGNRPRHEDLASP